LPLESTAAQWMWIFQQALRIDFESKRILRSEFDEILKDIRKYIHDKLKIDLVL
jgi:hypothetical protein